MKCVLVTGANGFVGQSVCAALVEADFAVSATVRDEKSLGYLPVDITGLLTGDLSLIRDWKDFLSNVDGVVHLAAHVHQTDETRHDSEDAYQRVNVGVTRSLAIACSKMGIQRLIFVSSVKAMGESTPPRKIWNESSPCLPQDAYGRSKYDAEKVLMDISRKTGLEVVILRLPLVYGPGVKANMASLFKIVDRGFPLPIESVKNLRSFLYVENLADVIRISLEHPAAAGETFLVSDGEDVSTPELIHRIAYALGHVPRLLPFPTSIIRLAGRMLGKTAKVERLLGSLVIDSSKIRRVLSWKPPYTMAQGLKQTADWYIEWVRRGGDKDMKK